MSWLSALGFRALAKLVDIPARSRVSQFETLPVGTPRIVMLGDSITEQGIWNEWFPNESIVNRGIVGDTSQQLRARLGSASLTQHTRAVFILIGTNDVGQGIPDERIVANVEAIITTVRDRSPQATVHLQSVMPRKSSHRERLQGLNARLRELSTGDGVVFVDLWPVLAAGDGSLRKEMTIDDIHLSGPGYEAWVATLRPLIEGTS